MPELSTLIPLIGFLLLVGAFSGVIAGLLGVGGGIMLVPAFFYTFSAPSVIGFMLLDVEGAPPDSVRAVNLVAFILIIAMTLITTPYGVRLAQRMDHP